MAQVKAVITGASSMLGIALINECIKNGIGVTAVARPGSAKNRHIPAGDGVNIIELGLSEIQKLPAALSGNHDVFFHLGWTNTDKNGRNDVLMQRENIEYTLNAVKAAKEAGCVKFIGAGSQAEYGRYERKINPDMKVSPETPYGAAKYSAGKLSAMYAEKIGLGHIWARVFSAYGPHDSDSTMIMYCISKLLKKEKPSLTKCGQKWDYIYCDDAALAFRLLWEKGRDKTVYNIGSGKVKKLSVYARAIRDAIDPKLPLGIGERDYAPGQVMHLCAGIDGLVKDTGFKPAVKFEDGIKRTIKWAEENFK
ncbi:MAG TPA: NAD(P)-dependent oxidoreductase [Candidatus Goldiibacteriota bacterium]|nr:NAD(P)-dependent oxidoreductase [Candidatus Goldiibacteriota bacterium]HRQ44158.1 NAD(P)-dependent oxidoreductase [Candidatus Goldiibacteriota bacterium]